MKEKFSYKKLSQPMMTGVSYMIPIIAMGGILQSIGTMIGGPNVLKLDNSFAYLLFTGGQVAMKFVVPILAAYISFAITDRPGLAPGFLVGYLSNQMNIGFLGGIIGGYLVGYFCRFIKNNLKVPKSMQALMPLLIIPLIGGIFSIILMKLAVGPFLAGLQGKMIELFKSMGTGSKFLFGSVLGGLVGVDMAGPVGKIGTTVANGLMADGVFEPEGAKVILCMVAPLSLGISSLIFKKKYTIQEKAAGKSAIFLGLFQVTEGGLPFLLADPFHVMPATIIGSAVAGGLSMIFGVTSPVTMGGLAAFPVMGNVFIGGIISLVIGIIVTVTLLSLFKKDVCEEAKDEVVKEVDDLDIDITF